MTRHSYTLTDFGLAVRAEVPLANGFTEHPRRRERCGPGVSVHVWGRGWRRFNLEITPENVPVVVRGLLE